MQDPINDSVLRLRDGRDLAFAEYGAADGFPVFHFHGGGSCRFDGHIYAEAAARRGIRLIAIDRPGVGRSDFKRGRKLLDIADDIAELADALSIEQFAVQAISAGAPYALACAHKLPERVTACNIISGMGPVEFVSSDMPMRFRAIFWSRHMPRVFGIATSVMYGFVRSEQGANRFLVMSANNFSEPDKRIIQDPQHRADIVATLLEASRQGSDGPITEFLIGVNSWGFDLSSIETPVTLWHGMDDSVVPHTMAEAVASALPNCQPMFLPDEGHYSIVVNHAETLLAAVKPADPTDGNILE